MRYVKTLCLLTVAVMVFAGVANADPVSLASLMDGQDDFITIGDKTFADFELECAAGDCASQGITPTNISVEAFIENGVYFLEFTGDMISGTDLDFLLRYTVTASAGLITMIDQSFGLSSGGTGGTIIISEEVHSGTYVGPQVALSNISFVLVGDFEDPLAEVGDDLIIDPGLTKAWVIKDVNIDADTGGLIGTSRLTQSFHQTVPEPTTLILLGTGLAGLAIWRKRSN